MGRGREKKQQGSEGMRKKETKVFIGLFHKELMNYNFWVMGR